MTEVSRLRAVAKPARRDASAELEQTLYAVRQKIYPRAVSGGLARWRTLFVVLTQLVFYGLPWLTWNGRQAVLFDLAARKFYIFGLVFFPQDFIFLTGLLVVSALSLFLFTAVAGRLWCGYACPQTVYTEMFLWVERKIEGDRLQRMKLDRAPLSGRKFALKAAKHVVWIAIALWTGFTFVGYFTPIKSLGAALPSLALGPWESFWILFYGFATYGNAGFMREQVCKYMCPYARFQSAMFDRDTLIISYDPKRGEPRGSRSRSTDRVKAGMGDCVDCVICVQVCPTGIDIRNGLQYECIGCGACIDGCNQVMDKMGYPKGLIRYTTENALEGRYAERGFLSRLLRPRVLVYTAILWSLIFALGIALYQRAPVKLDAMRDRGVLSRETSEGLIENIYRLQIMNTAEQPRKFRLSASGIAGIQLLSELHAQDEASEADYGPAAHAQHHGNAAISVPAAATRVVAVEVRAQREALKPGANRIEFHAVAEDDAKVRASARSTFLMR